ncbi:MAG: anhydro-N-acetylmuramic acid kinase [Pseudomonadota bacterium]
MEGKRGIAVGSGQPIWALGFMTGTSMDGVDAAVLLTDGETLEMFGPSHSIPFGEAQIAGLRTAIDWCADHWPNNGKLRAKADLWDIAELRLADELLVAAHVEASDAIMSRFHDRPDKLGPAWQHRVFERAERIELIGFHGQTVLHRPEEGYTLQIGDGALLAEESPLNTPVIHDFRAADMAAGGEGAPLAPFYHFALARKIEAEAPVAFLNIGGVGNVTWVDPSRAAPEEDGALMAFDTGPGNALVDDWMARKTGMAIDQDGQAAAEGTIRLDRLRSNYAEGYLSRLPPKSLDRNEFAGVLSAIEGLSIADGAATLAHFTVECVVRSQTHMPSKPSRWLVCGGGRHNRTMMKMLGERLDAPVEPVEAVGLDGDMLEAQAFAYLAVRVLRGLPTSAPSTTGCRTPVCGGQISYPPE